MSDVSPSGPDARSALVRRAREAREQAYAPYSGYAVGAALETADGTIFTGCNVENASYGLTMCAERVAVGAALAAGHRDFVRIVVSTADDPPASPCGACRQVLAEFAPGLEVCGSGRTTWRAWSLDELLPARFDLEAPRGPRTAGPSHDQRTDG